MTIKELQEKYPKNEIEIYQMKSHAKHWRGIHTDTVEYVEEPDSDTEVFTYELMDAEEYDNTILANTDITCEEWGLLQGEDEYIVVAVIKKQQAR